MSEAPTDSSEERQPAKDGALLGAFAALAMQPAARRVRAKSPNDPVRTISGRRIDDPRPSSVVTMDDGERQFRHKVKKRRAQNKAGRKARIRNRGK